MPSVFGRTIAQGYVVRILPVLGNIVMETRDADE